MKRNQLCHIENNADSDRCIMILLVNPIFPPDLQVARILRMYISMALWFFIAFILSSYCGKRLMGKIQRKGLISALNDCLQTSRFYKTFQITENAV